MTPARVPPASPVVGQAPEPQQACHRQEQLHVHRHEPEACRQGLVAEEVVQEKRMRDQLADARRRRDRRMGHETARQFIRGDREDQDHVIRQGKPHESVPQDWQDRIGPQPALRCEGARGEVASDDQENLHRHSGVVRHPAPQRRHDRLEVVGHRPVEDEVVHDHERRCHRLHRVDKQGTMHHCSAAPDWFIGDGGRIRCLTPFAVKLHRESWL